MRLTKLSYKDKDWELRDLGFDKVCLLVGKNSTGKSKTLSTIDYLGKLITQKIGFYKETEWNVTYQENNDELNYKFRIGHSNSEWVVEYEEIALNKETFLQRTGPETATIYNSLSRQKESINPPANKLVIHATRDVKKYPFLEDIAIWAENSFGFKFGSISPDRPINQEEFNLLTVVEEIPLLFKSLSLRSREQVKKSFEHLGYKIDLIDYVDEDKGFGRALFIKEATLKNYLPHYMLSQGMFRSLFLLIFIEYLLNRNKTATIIIDDFCEGLDYDRATKLGKLIFKKCEEDNIQLIATSNDMFLMDVVDIVHWNVLQRNGIVVTALNAKNHQELFEKFRYTGLSNFDFFASDYISQTIDK
ncbi:MAG TPA: ATP-binding protein [Puia sp.]|nr:ATP-binding protein [Puia sp.]